MDLFNYRPRRSHRVVIGTVPSEATNRCGCKA